MGPAGKLVVHHRSQGAAIATLDAFFLMLSSLAQLRGGVTMPPAAPAPPSKPPS